MPSDDYQAPDDDQILFWAERDASYSWGPFAIGLFAVMPLAPLDPLTAACGLTLAALVCAWSRSSFIFRLCRTHIAVRGAALDPIYKVAWCDVREASAAHVRRPWLGRERRGEVQIVLIDDTRVRIPGVRDPAAASEAVNAIVARHAAARAPALRPAAA